VIGEPSSGAVAFWRKRDKSSGCCTSHEQDGEQNEHRRAENGEDQVEDREDVPPDRWLQPRGSMKAPFRGSAGVELVVGGERRDKESRQGPGLRGSRWRR
jgi:hypothetical protein